MKRNVLNSPRLLEFKKKRQKIFLNKIFLSLFALLFIFAGLAYISHLEQLNISEVEITGNKVESKEMIETAVKKEITGNYLWFFPKTNIFFYPKDNIEKDLFNQFNRLKSVSLSVENKTLKVSLDERIALYTWCGEMMNSVDGLSKEEKCYFIDEAGYIFAEAPYFSGEVYFKFYGATDSKENTPIGSYFLADIFQKLILFKEALSHMGLKPAVLYMDKEENEDIKIFLSSANTLPNAPEIIFKADSDLEIIAENLQTALTTEPLQSNFKNKYSSLLYIDLRYGNKVYYKFK